MTDHKGKLSPLLKQATGITAAKGEGAYIIDPEGRRYLDFTSGIGVTSTGHCHPKVVAAAQKQVRQSGQGGMADCFGLKVAAHGIDNGIGNAETLIGGALALVGQDPNQRRAGIGLGVGWRRFFGQCSGLCRLMGSARIYRRWP